MKIHNPEHEISPLTPEEQALHDAAEEEIENKFSVFSFDIERLKERVQGDGWQQVIQSHLYFDHVVSLALTEALYKPEAIRVSRMSFSQKLQLVEAMGLFPEFILRPIERINSLRNRIAHDLNFELTDKDTRDLANIVPRMLREGMIKQRTTPDKGPIALWEIAILYVVLADQARQQNAVKRTMQKKAQVGVKEALNNLYRGLIPK